MVFTSSDSFHDHEMFKQEYSGRGHSIWGDFKILIQREIICDNILNFGKFVKIWHYIRNAVISIYFCSIFEGQISTCNFSYTQDGILTNRPCSDFTLVSSYDKIVRC